VVSSRSFCADIEELSDIVVSACETGVLVGIKNRVGDLWQAAERVREILDGSPHFTMPEPGQWWGNKDGRRFYCAGMHQDTGEYVVRRDQFTQYKVVRFSGDLLSAGWRHLPECDSFDWVDMSAKVDPPPVAALEQKMVDNAESVLTKLEGDVAAGGSFPQYWTTTNPEIAAFVRRESKNVFCTVFKDGMESEGNKWTGVDQKNRRLLTEAEAMALLTPNNKPETFPQWYKLTEEHKHGGGEYRGTIVLCVKVESEINGVTFFSDGRQYAWGREVVHPSEIWIKITEAEANSLLASLKPAQDPEEWVTQDRVPDRPGIDQWRRVWLGDVAGEWTDSGPSSVQYKHGDMCHSSQSVLEVRCRRKDLPPIEPQSAPIAASTEQRREERWVVQDRMNVRTYGCDQVRWSTWPEGYWERAEHYVEDFRHGYRSGNSVLSVRCLEDNLPSLTQGMLYRDVRPFEELPSINDKVPSNDQLFAMVVHLRDQMEILKRLAFRDADKKN
jgi:hypothetical protein